MSTTATVPSAPLLLRRPWALRLVLGAAAIALGDWLFWRRPVGISVALFLLALGGSALAANPIRATRKELALGVAALLLGFLAVVEDLDILSFLFALGGAAGLALVAAREGSGSSLRKPIESALLLLCGPARLVADLLAAVRWLGTRREGMLNPSRLAGWIVPVVLAAVFVFLFREANPLVERWLAEVDLAALFARLDASRMAFWACMLVAAWPFLHVRMLRRAKATAPAAGAPVLLPETPPQQADALSVLLSPAAIGRSLVLFNLLFAIQTATDAAYLWGGVELPAGMSYASYAHRGAYPLIVTALLAAAFVLVAMRPGGAAETSRPLRVLVYLWVAQTIALVLSSILRLDLYVATYALTYWRVAAFIWMGLVAVGLTLIVARIALRRSNEWLVTANLAALALTLYGCCFMNFAGLIAEYNVDQRLRAKDPAILDIAYLRSLGPEAIPAIDRVLAAIPAPPCLTPARNAMAARHLRRMADWRAWSFRDWRLSGYLQRNPSAPSRAAEGAPNAG